MLGLLIITLGCAVGVTSGAPAVAAPGRYGALSTCGTFGDSFDGYLFNPAAHANTLEGASAYIMNRFGAVCNTDRTAPNPPARTLGTNRTLAWVMIAAYDGNGWAQVGFIRGFNSPQYEFAQFYNPTNGFVATRFPSSPTLADGVKHAYRALWNANCACIIMSIDGVEVTQTNFNPFDDWNSGPNGDQFRPEFSGEVSYKENDMPGTPSAPTEFSALGAQQEANDSLGPMPCALTAVNNNPARWAYKASSCTAFNIWTSNTA
jgi:hypothetical protein